MKINYSFQVLDGPAPAFEVSLDPRTLEDVSPVPERLPKWTRLEVERCENCPLDPNTSPHCPTAVQLVEVVESFTDITSVGRMRVKVESSERVTSKETTVADGLSALIGLKMATSGCPVLGHLRPITRVHVPFATEDENQLRALSNYLVAQFLRARQGLEPDFSLEGLNKVYREVNKVNKAFAKRLRSATNADANANALMRLELFARAIPSMEAFLAIHALAFGFW